MTKKPRCPARLLIYDSMIEQAKKRKKRIFKSNPKNNAFWSGFLNEPCLFEQYTTLEACHRAGSKFRGGTPVWMADLSFEILMREAEAK